jgi:hypothetical protein
MHAAKIHPFFLNFEGFIVLLLSEFNILCFSTAHATAVSYQNKGRRYNAADIVK